MWDNIFSTFEIRGTITYPLFGTNELDRYEHEINLSLPKSYRQFCLKFGPGQIVPPVRYNIAAPGRDPWESDSELRHLNRIAKDSVSGVVDEYTADPLDVSRLSRALYFASDMIPQFYFWDTSELTSAENAEYAVYVIQRLGNIERLADTFFDFVANRCLVTGVPGYSPSVERQRIFIPADIPASVK